MRLIFAGMPAFLLAGLAVAQSEGRSHPGAPGTSAPPVEFRSAFDGYRPFAEQERTDWRKANDGVGAAGGHAGHGPGQGPGQQTSKPQPGAPASSGAHGGHK